MNILRYLFWPNPGFAEYYELDIIFALALSGGLIVLSFLLSFWRKRQSNSMTRKLSSSWSTAALWFGLVGLFLTVARVEQIQYFAMRFLWVLWTAALLLFVFIQVKKWRMKHYEVMPSVKVIDPRNQYLPKKKRRK